MKMKNGKIHLIIGTAICAATMLLFLAFYNQLPESVPIQITIDGSVGNAIPKQLFVFGFPIIFVVVNLIKALQLARKENAPVCSFYIVPVIAVILSVLTLGFAMSL
jgi:uncharacterized membrane protein